MDHLACSVESFIDEVPQSLEDAKSRPDYRYWKEAIDNEINTLERNQTWTLVKREKNIKLIDGKWVFKIKRDGNGEPIKFIARLVARGFMQIEGFDYEETYAPVARLTTIRILLAIINYRNLQVHQMDVKSAFLHGSIDENIYMKQPEGLEGNNDLVCKLNKSLYGLKEAPFCWNKTFDEFIK